MRKIRFLALLLISCLLLGGALAFAAPWSEEYYRASDVTDELTEAEQEDLDADCLAFVKAHRLDLAMLAVTPEYYEGETLEEHARAYYESCGFGYGDTKDGFAMIYDAETEELVIVPVGAAKDAVSGKFLTFVANAAKEFRAEHGIWGVMYATYKHLDNYLTDPSQYDAQGGGESAPDTRESAGGGMPDWYPADPQHFQFFHDENAPRVVDDADIFSDAEEQAMESRIAVLRQELQRDIVVFTDNSDHGLGHDIYAADFYDFNGYGYGPEREGFCLFICMQEGNRGFWTCGTGTDSMALQTERTANALDDALYEYMAAGEYGAGAANWIENIAVLYRKGIPFAPDWYPDRNAPVERERDGASPRVVDDKGELAEPELGMLETRARTLASRYGVDIVIHIMDEPACIAEQEYMDVFFRSGGYGFGEDGDAIVVTVIRRWSDYWICHVAGHGSYAQRLTETAQSRLEDHTASRISSIGAYRTLDRCLDETEHFLRTGRAPRTTGAWIRTGVLASLLGAIFGGVALAKAKKKMKTVREQTNANSYLVRGSLRVDRLRDDYVGTTTSRRYDPVERSSSSGSSSSSSSGHSTYHSSYHGSSGSSHSGSGRRF
ncbi:MAG: TPM domain-containing protein [Ruminococcaceae bacterium]|jgi:uncharacterized membrane protein YgcG|nr:TPM domain-containing protein [Oscillospiraceae bacterium]